VSKIKLINKDTDIDILKIRQLGWDIEIDGRPYYACFIDDYVHSIGGHWGENNIWGYPRDEEPSYDNLIELQIGSPVNWGIRYEPHHTLKTKWDRTRADTSNQVIITRNGKDFYNCFSIAKAQAILETIDDHPMNLDEIDFDKKVVGRKIWWRSEPAIITKFNWGICTVSIKPDGIEHFSIPAEHRKDEIPYYEDGESSIHTSIFDNHIWWFRD
jgi:hypothetical protein